MGGSAISEMDSNRGKTGRVGGSCRASQAELSGKQWDGRARGCGGKAGCGRRLLWVVINHSQQMSWSRRGGYRKKKLRRSLGDDKEWDWGRSGEEKNRRGRSTQTLSRRWDVSPAFRCRGTGAGVGISDLPAGLQAEPERARLRHALQSQPRQLLRLPRLQPPGTAGPPRPSPTPRLPACPGRASRSPADLATSLRL